MKNSVVCLLIAVMSLFSLPAVADEGTQNLTICLTDSLNGKERKLLAKWIFAAIAAHPEIIDLSAVSAEARDLIDEDVGNLITRLLSVDCDAELVAAMSRNPLALQDSFKVVGEVAMMELLNERSVADALTGYVKYVDMQAIESITKK